MFILQGCFKFLLISFVCDTVSGVFDPISLGIGGILSGGIYMFKDPLKKYTFCKLVECCSADYIPADFLKLEEDLQTKLYGQHLAQAVVLSALKSHFREQHPQKALTLSFHGMPGSGKNYVTNFIIKALYKQGYQSKFVHHFTARIHFPVEAKAAQYRSELQSWIKGNVSNCERSLFVFDEVDKMPPNVLDAIKPMMDYYDYVDKVDYRKTIFIFLSNTGSKNITDRLMHLWKDGIKRNQIQLKDFEHLMKLGAFNEIGGFQNSDAIRNSLIDHFIPFLPMEKKHLELCVKDQFLLRGCSRPSPSMIDDVLEVVEWGPVHSPMYSTTGCKRLGQKVPLVMHNHNIMPKYDKQEL